MRVVIPPLGLGVHGPALEPFLELTEVVLRVGSCAGGGCLVLDGAVELLLELAEVLLDAVELHADGLAPLLLLLRWLRVGYVGQSGGGDAV